jgi:AraC-like DNA-binding protein
MGTDWSQVRLPEGTFGINQEWDTLDTGWQAFPGHYLLYASSGTFTLEVDDRQWLLPPQRAAWVRADVQICLRATSRVTCSSILFARDTIPAPAFDCRVFAVSPLAREMILYAMRWGLDRKADDAAADQFFVTVANVCAELAAQPEQFWLPRARSEDMTRAIEYILEHLESALNADEIADGINLSKRTLSRRFSEEIQMTCGQFIHRARLLRAMERLIERADTPVIDVAYSVGFESVSAFTTAFRQFAQETPSAYRKRFLPQ